MEWLGNQNAIQEVQGGRWDKDKKGAKIWMFDS